MKKIILMGSLIALGLCLTTSAMHKYKNIARAKARFSKIGTSTAHIVRQLPNCRPHCTIELQRKTVQKNSSISSNLKLKKQELQLLFSYFKKKQFLSFYEYMPDADPAYQALFSLGFAATQKLGIYTLEDLYNVLSNNNQAVGQH